jgi:hypothetical protein
MWRMPFVPRSLASGRHSSTASRLVWRLDGRKARPSGRGSASISGSGYFSLTTLSTIGFGDITPLTLQARYLAVAEGITGQFYMAILVARLVGLQMSQSAGQHTENEAPFGAEKSGRNRDLAFE